MAKNKSEKSHAVLDVDSRRNKAKKLINIISSFTDIDSANVLDIGTGAGIIAEELGSVAKNVESVDLYDERVVKKNFNFTAVKDETLPFDDDTFDVVVSNHVVEHVPDQKKHFYEIVRVLKPGGYVYLATPNKLWFTDPHHKLPFISWLPRPLSNAYLRVAKGKVWDIYPVTHMKVKKELGDHHITKGVPHALKQIAGSNTGPIGKVIKRTPDFMLKPAQYVSPTLIYLVKKRQK